MGRIGILLSFSRVERNSAKISDVKIDPGGGPNITAEHFAPAGDDSFPLKTDYVVTNEIPRTGGETVIGYVDPINTPKANPGDKRTYARDPNTGAVIGEIWQKNDGTITLINANGSFTLNPDGSQKGINSGGSFELQSNGDFLVNGVKIDSAGVVTIPASLILAGKEIAGHDHSQANDSGGNVEQDTGPNN